MLEKHDLLLTAHPENLLVPEKVDRAGYERVEA